MAEGPGVALALGECTNQCKRRARRVIDLHHAWDAAESGKGYAAKAAEWREKLPEENGE